MLIFNISACVYYLHVSKAKAAEISELINAFIQFDKMYPKRAKKLADISLKQRLGMLMATLLFFSQNVDPFGVAFGFRFNDPWKTSLARYWLIPKPTHENAMDYIAP